MTASWKHGKIMAEQTRLLETHDQRITFQDQILANQKEIRRQLGEIQVGNIRPLGPPMGW